VLLLSAALLIIPSLPIVFVLSELAQRGLLLPGQRDDVVSLTSIDLILPFLLYGLWTGVASFRAPPQPGSGARRALGWATAAFLCTYAPSVVALPLLPWLQTIGALTSGAPAWYALRWIQLGLGATLAAVALWLSLRDARRRKRHGWIAALVLTPIFLTVAGPLELLSLGLSRGASLTSADLNDLFTLVIAFFIVGCLLVTFPYCLWAGNVEVVPPKQTADVLMGP
jgi:hypothetical protein